ncbi:hypothetical protein [Cetobacterium sp. 8H]
MSNPCCFNQNGISINTQFSDNLSPSL